jgi:hypothetical protein
MIPIPSGVRVWIATGHTDAPVGRPVTNIRNTTSLAGLAEARKPLPGPVQQLRRIRAGAEAGNWCGSL